MQFLKSSAVYGGSSIINKAIPFLILPILTRYLTPSEYGFIAIFQVLLTFLTPFVDLNLSQNIMRKFFRLQKADMAAYVSSILAVLLTSFTVVMVITAVIVLTVGDLFDLPARWLAVLPAIALMNMVNKCNLTLLIQQSRPVTYGIVENANTILNVSLTLLLIVVYEWGWEGRTAGILGASITLGIISLIHMWRRGYLLFRVERAAVREITGVSLPLVPHAIGIVVIGFSDRLFIDWLVDKESVGLYALGYQFGMITMLAADAFFKSWGPWFFKNIDGADDQRRRMIVKYTYLGLAGFFAAGLLITVGSHVVFPLMIDPRYAGGLEFVIWIAMAYATRGIYQFMIFYILLEGKTRFLAINTTIAALANVVLNYVLIRESGPVGAAQASLIAFGIMALGGWWYANRIHAMPWFSARPAVTQG